MNASQDPQQGHPEQAGAPYSAPRPTDSPWLKNIQDLGVDPRLAGDQRRKSPTLAALLSLMPGLGQVYVGYYQQGFIDIAVAAGQEDENVILDAVGPETYTFEELVRLIAEKVGSGVLVIHARPGLALFLSRLIGYAVRDVVLTGDEVRGLMANLLVSAKPPLGRTRLSEWLRQYGDRLGRAYAAELKRHYL